MAKQAAEEHSKSKTEKPKKRVKMIALAGGGQRPETAGDRCAARMIARAEKRKPDAATAFHLADGLHQEALEVKNLIAALRMMASSEECRSSHVGDALFGIVHAMESRLDVIKETLVKITGLTWGYAMRSPSASATEVSDE